MKIKIKKNFHIPNKQDEFWLRFPSVPMTLSDLLDYLKKTIPPENEQTDFSGRMRTLVTVNGRVIKQELYKNTILQDGDEVFLIRPIAGG